MRQRILMAVLLVAALSGCASFGRGVAEAVLDRESEDERACHIEGSEFGGLAQSLDATANNPSRTTKMLMIHGIGEHPPGYSTRMRENLANALDLTVREARFKELDLFSPEKDLDPIGNLRIHRLLSEDFARELLFYELTWSKIAEADRAIVAFDQSGENSFRRATINNALKGFLNAKIPDPLIYLGKERETILISAAQSICWMLAGDWDGLPESARQACDPVDQQAATELLRDDFFFVTHSMGSRIFTDSLQRLAELITSPEYHALLPDTAKILRQSEWTVYMLANQLPLLQMGREKPDITGRIPQMCTVPGSEQDERFLRRTSIVAFSDPNDILSYKIPPKFANEFLDSRICPAVTNVDINVSSVADLFGLGTFADPLKAHVGYDDDERVIGMIAQGFGPGRTAPAVQERCTFTRTINEFGRER